ncbi:MAG: hypothetical protein ACOYJQ_06680 [Pseudochelatococcus sp.]
MRGTDANVLDGSSLGDRQVGSPDTRDGNQAGNGTKKKALCDLHNHQSPNVISCGFTRKPKLAGWSSIALPLHGTELRNAIHVRNLIHIALQDNTAPRHIWRIRNHSSRLLHK